MPKKVKVKCAICDGDKKKNYGRGMEDCRYCEGKGYVWAIDQSK